MQRLSVPSRDYHRAYSFDSATIEPWPHMTGGPSGPEWGQLVSSAVKVTHTDKIVHA